MTRLRNLMVSVLAFVALGCRGPAGPDFDPATIQIDFSAWVPRTYDEPDVVVGGEAGAVMVESHITTGQGGYTLRPTLARLRSGVYRLTVEANATSPGITIPIRQRYRALMHPWPAGRYRLVVVAQVPDEKWQREVFDDVVEVR